LFRVVFSTKNNVTNLYIIFLEVVSWRKVYVVCAIAMQLVDFFLIKELLFVLKD